MKITSTKDSPVVIEMLEITANLANGPGIIHPTLIRDEKTVILVDTGLPGLLPQFREAFETAGISFDILDKIIITHHDMDHIGGLSGILNECAQRRSQRVEVLAHENEKPYIQTEVPPLRLVQLEAQLHALPEERAGQMKVLYENLKANYKKFKAIVDKTVSDGEELPYCGGITVIFTPGHTPGHICLYLKKNKTLIAGDTMNVEEGILVPAPLFTTFDKEAAASSIKKLTRYDIDTVICYHGGLYNSNVNQRIAELALDK